MDAVLDPASGEHRIRRAFGEQRGRERARGLALARAGRAVEEVCVRGVAVRGQRGAQHGAGVRVLLGVREGWAIVTGTCEGTGVRGALITIEGIDGAGKSTLAAGARARASRGLTSSCCASRAASSCPSGSARW